MSPSHSACACLAGALLLSSVTAASAQDVDLEAMPRPGVADVRTLGYWQGDDGTGGDVRLVSIDSGLEEPRFASYIVWSLRDFDKRSIENVAAAPLIDCERDVVGQVEFVEAVQPDLDGSVLLKVVPLEPSAQVARTALVYEIDGKYGIKLAAGCS